MTFKTSIDEYTPDEIKVNGNGMYGGKRHDEICDYLQSRHGLSDSQINDVSMGVWLAIDSEKSVREAYIKQLEDEIVKLWDSHPSSYRNEAEAYGLYKLARHLKARLSK